MLFDARMVAPVQGYSPSAQKPAQALQSWQANGMAIEVMPFEPLSAEQISSAHCPAYVEGVLKGEIANGFGTHAPEVAASLPYTSGAMYAAALVALVNQQVACAPVSGFHHAHWNAGGAFCTFNGLMVTAMLLQRMQPDIRVGILDLDEHWGDGTDQIIGQLGAAGWVSHFSGTQGYGTKHRAELFLNDLPSILKTHFSRCDVVLYQAGADCHVDDPLGGWLTTEQMRKRDELVFAGLSTLRVPVAWNLAGGYQEPIERVLELHDNTMRACCTHASVNSSARE